MKFELYQVSIFYLLLIAVLAYVGYKFSVRLIKLSSDVGAFLGGLAGLIISFYLFRYVSSNNMLEQSTYRL